MSILMNGWYVTTKCSIRLQPLLFDYNFNYLLINDQEGKNEINKNKIKQY